MKVVVEDASSRSRSAKKGQNVAPGGQADRLAHRHQSEEREAQGSRAGQFEGFEGAGGETPAAATRQCWCCRHRTYQRSSAVLSQHQIRKKKKKKKKRKKKEN